MNLNRILCMYFHTKVYCLKLRAINHACSIAISTMLYVYPSYTPLWFKYRLTNIVQYIYRYIIIKVLRLRLADNRRHLYARGVKLISRGCSLHWIKLDLKFDTPFDWCDLQVDITVENSNPARYNARRANNKRADEWN